MKELEQIKGIGAAMAEALADLVPPVETLQDLIDWDTEALAEHIDGASAEKVLDWQAQAIMLLAARAEKEEANGKDAPETEAGAGVPAEEAGKVRVWVHAREGRFLPGKGLGSRLYGEYFLVTAEVAAQLTQTYPEDLRLDKPNSE